MGNDSDWLTNKAVYQRKKVFWHKSALISDCEREWKVGEDSCLFFTFVVLIDPHLCRFDGQLCIWTLCVFEIPREMLHLQENLINLCSIFTEKMRYFFPFHKYFGSASSRDFLSLFYVLKSTKIGVYFWYAFGYNFFVCQSILEIQKTFHSHLHTLHNTIVVFSVSEIRIFPLAFLFRTCNLYHITSNFLK